MNFQGSSVTRELLIMDALIVMPQVLDVLRVSIPITAGLICFITFLYRDKNLFPQMILRASSLFCTLGICISIYIPLVEVQRFFASAITFVCCVCNE
ncbi:hypothetical protein CsatB_014577 [Cannabis sativa]